MLYYVFGNITLSSGKTDVQSIRKSGWTYYTSDYQNRTAPYRDWVIVHLENEFFNLERDFWLKYFTIFLISSFLYSLGLSVSLCFSLSLSQIRSLTNLFYFTLWTFVLTMLFSDVCGLNSEMIRCSWTLWWLCNSSKMTSILARRENKQWEKWINKWASRRKRIRSRRNGKEFSSASSKKYQEVDKTDKKDSHQLKFCNMDT